MFHSSPESEAINRELQLSFLLDDIAAWGPKKVERVLRTSYPPFKWKVAVFDDFIYVIQTPSEEWLLAATRKRWLRMEDVQFPIVRWDHTYNTGKRLTSLWLRLHGFSYDLWTWDEFSRVVSPYGAVVLELDPGTRFRYDYRFSRIRIGIGDPTALPRFHNLTHRSPTGFVSTSDIEFEIETATTESVNAWRGRLNGRPYPNGTHFGVAPPPSTEPPRPTSPVIPPTQMNIDPPHSRPSHSTLNPSLITQPMTQQVAPGHPRAASAPPVNRIPVHTPSLRSPIPPTRGRGIHISDSPSRPVIGTSPPEEKGKAPLHKCRPEEPFIHDYDSDDSDEDSFQRALSAINNMEFGIGTSGNGASHTPPPHLPSHTQAPPPHDTDSVPSSGINQLTLAPPPVTLVAGEYPNHQSCDSDNEPIANIIDRLIDEEPLMLRAAKLHAQKLKSQHKKHWQKKSLG